jgi:hypothetical protein
MALATAMSRAEDGDVRSSVGFRHDAALPRAMYEYGSAPHAPDTALRCFPPIVAVPVSLLVSVPITLILLPYA